MLEYLGRRADTSIARIARLRKQRLDLGLDQKQTATDVGPEGRRVAPGKLPIDFESSKSV